MKRILALLLVAAMMFTFVSCDGAYKSEFTDYAEGKIYVEMVIKGYGLMTIELEPSVAPITVHNFATLVSEGFYDGLTIFRAQENFVIQGGKDDAVDLEPIKGEFSSNGYTNNISHLRGVISMARTDVPDSASSQFFIMHADAPHLDGAYAAFGRVVSGMETVDEIAEVPTDYSDRPKVAMRMKRVYIAE